MENCEVIVTKRRLLRKDIELKGKILKTENYKYEDWLNSEYEEKVTIIKLENGKIIKIVDGGCNLFDFYSFKKIN